MLIGKNGERLASVTVTVEGDYTDIEIDTPSPSSMFNVTIERFSLSNKQHLITIKVKSNEASVGEHEIPIIAKCVNRNEVTDEARATLIVNVSTDTLSLGKILDCNQAPSPILIGRGKTETVDVYIDYVAGDNVELEFSYRLAPDTLKIEILSSEETGTGKIYTLGITALQATQPDEYGISYQFITKNKLSGAVIDTEQIISYARVIN